MKYPTSSIPNSTSAIGSFIGMRRPRYELLDDLLPDIINSSPIGKDIFLFINLNSILKQLYSEYTTAKVSKSELQRNPRMLSAELLNLVGHYRNYIYKYFNRNTSIFLYHSTEYCDDKLLIYPEYKSKFYSKRLSTDAELGEFKLIKGYVDYNIKIAQTVCKKIPNLYLVDTGKIDPEAFPAILNLEGRVDGTNIIMSSWYTDLQYAIKPNTYVLKANGDHTKLIGFDNLLDEAYKDVKEKNFIELNFSQDYFPFTLALAGDSDLGSAITPKYGIGKAFKQISKIIANGHIDSIDLFVEECNLSEAQKSIVEINWKLLNHDAYGNEVLIKRQDILANIDLQLVNLSCISDIEKVNIDYFNGSLNLDMIFAGEDF
jgi:hypothetical protein